MLTSRSGLFYGYVADAILPLVSVLYSRNMTKEDREDMRREIAEYKATQNNTKVKEAVLV